MTSESPSRKIDFKLDMSLESPSPRDKNSPTDRMGIKNGLVFNK